MSEEARQVKDWGMEHHAMNTWPRSDYQELLQLVLVALGGTVRGFKFQLPGDDHHAK